jgi:hypothetical protein
VLQTSDKIDHWSAIIQEQKNTSLFEHVTLEYVNRSFPVDHTQHLKSEPMVPYNTDLYSTSFFRGNDVSLDQYFLNAIHKQDARILKCINFDLQTNLIFNKPQIPLFCNNSKAITVSLTSQQEKEWLYKTLWSKHFLETDTEIRYIPDDPHHCSFYSLVSVLTYKNPYCFPVADKDKLYQEYIINNHTNSWYFDTDRFFEYDTTHCIDNIFIKLDEILVVEKFLLAIEQIFNYHKLGIPNFDLIQKMHKIWMSGQITYDL